MPSIIINEKDLTTSPSPDYANFTVVVPGIYDVTKTNPFDDNGIYECSTQTDFIEKIGLMAGINGAEPARWAEPTKRELPEGVEATFDNLYTFTVSTSAEAFRFMSTQQFYQDYWGMIYKITVDGSTEPETCGAYKFEFKASETATPVYYVFNPVAETTYPADPNAKFVLIPAGKAGNDAKANSYNLMGNQIAYTLLGLGYTVLYKKVNYTANAWQFEDLDTEPYWECLLDRSAYDFRYLTLGGYNSKLAQNQISAIATYVKNANTGRGDCIALIDIDDKVFNTKTLQKEAAKDIEAYAASINNAGTNSAFLCPTVTYNITPPTAYNSNRTFPASFHYLACASKAFLNYKEWFAVANYTRGICDFSIISVGYKFGDIAANILAPRTPETDGFKCVNLIITEKNNYYIWGNRTAAALDKAAGLKASHFLNIRQLMCTLKKRLYVICRQFTFEPNSDLLWVKFRAAVEPILEDMKANEGVFDYRILKVKDAKKAKLTAVIRLVPIEAVEDFEITCYLENDLSSAIAIEVAED